MNFDDYIQKGMDSLTGFESKYKQEYRSGTARNNWPARVCIHQLFLRTFLVLFSRFFPYLDAFESKTTSLWLSLSEVLLFANLQTV